MDQILSNLVLNARDAIASAGSIRVRVGREDDGVVLDVTDDGAGMGEEQLGRALEPYFTTKPLERGTGLGLSTVHGLVAAAGGRVELRSSPGVGTTVRVWLPLRPQGEVPPNRELADQGRLDEALAILVLDDQPDVARGMARIMKRNGWQAHVATSLAQAEDLLRDHRVDLVVSDVVMPDTDGPRARDRLRELVPDIPVLFVSGYAPDDLPGLGEDPLLSKPFTADELRQAIHDTLVKSRGFR